MTHDRQKSLTKFTLESKSLRDLVDADQGGVPNFPQNIGQDGGRFYPESDGGGGVHGYMTLYADRGADERNVLVAFYEDRY